MSTSDTDEWDWGAEPKGRAGSRFASSGGGGRKRPEPIGGRGAVAKIRAAGRTPEAVVKVISFGKSASSARQLMDYLSRKGELEVTLKDGSTLNRKDGLDGTDAVIDTWSLAFGERVNARNFAHVLVSSPHGSKVSDVRAAAFDFGSQVFGEGRDFAMVVHTDTDNPHVHFMVVKDGPEAEALSFSKSELQAMREAWADRLRERDIVVNATPRAVRGSGERGESMRVRKARDREGFSRVDENAAKDVLTGLASNSDNPTAWEDSISAQAKVDRAEYEELAELFSRLSADLGEGESGLVQSTARLLRRQSMALRHTMTRRQHMRRIAIEQKIHGNVPDDRAAKMLAMLYRADKDARMDKERFVNPASDETMRKRLDNFSGEMRDKLSALSQGGNTDAKRLVTLLETDRGREKDFDLSR